MTSSEILKFLNANPMCHLATLESGRPRVRGMLMYRADEQGLLFHTGIGKALSQQVQNGAPAEACFNSPELQVRVAGTTQIVDDLELKKEIVAARPFMQPWVAQRGYGLLVVFRIVRCEAAVWTMAANFEPTKYQKI